MLNRRSLFVRSVSKQRSYSLLKTSAIICNKKEPTTMILILISYWLCVSASGSVITDKFSFRILINVSCLHLGQNNGKFSRIVSSLILVRVLLLQTGHNIHFLFSIAPSPYKYKFSYLIFLIKISKYQHPCDILENRIPT